MVARKDRQLAKKFFAFRLGSVALALVCLALIGADPGGKWDQPVNCDGARKNLPPYPERVKAFRYDTKPPIVEVTINSNDGTLMVQTIEFDRGDGLKCSG